MALIIIAAAAVVIVTSNEGSADVMWEGNGTQGEPYLISDAAGLAKLADDVNNEINSYKDTYFQLTSDINLGVAPYNTGNGWEPIGHYINNTNDPYSISFDGNFDGKGYVVTGLYLTNNNYDAYGVFGCITGEIKNLGVEKTNIVLGVDVNVHEYRVGGVVGYNNGGTVTDCYNTGAVIGSYCSGGVVGYNGGTVANCYNTGNVSGVQCAGGVVGESSGEAIITNCYNTGPVSSNGTAGGVVGPAGEIVFNSGKIENCYNTGAVSGDGCAGGVVGANMVTITNCYNAGAVNSGFFAGGVAGFCGENTIVTNCYNTGAVSCDEYVGGVVGANGATITNCYNTGAVSGNLYAGGVAGAYLYDGVSEGSFFLKDTGVNTTLSGIGDPSSDTGATPEKSAAMKKESTFTDAKWDFNDTWIILPGVNNGYPILFSMPLPEAQHAMGVTLNKSTLSLGTGSNGTLTATVSPADAADNSVTWSSSDASVAKVSGNGVVTGVSAGTATITVMTNDGGYTADCAVTVVQNPTGVALDKTAISLDVGSSDTLTATVSPADAEGKSVTWSSSDGSVATVSNGVVTAVGAGTATITVKTNAGGYTASCTVTVIQNPTGVALDKTAFSLDVGSSGTLTVTMSPADATKSLTWSSSDTSIATVNSNGVVTAVGAGTATITVKTNDGGYTADCTVTVNGVSSGEKTGWSNSYAIIIVAIIILAILIACAYYFLVARKNI